MCGFTASTQPRVRLVRKHHLLVRASHWLNVLLLAGLIVSGISIYWASPIYQHGPDPRTGNSDYFADAVSGSSLMSPGFTAIRARPTCSTTISILDRSISPLPCAFICSSPTFFFLTGSFLSLGL